jgi:lambda family phage tail tape measure protein
MAKKIEELVVELGIKGLEGLDNLSSSFRNLQKAIGPSDNAITQVRRSILDMSSAGKQSIQMIQGQIDAFKGLQTQATIGSNIYRQLSGDVNRLSDTLRQLRGDYEEVGRAARQTDAQIANQFPARKPEAFRVQLAALNRELGQLSVSARAYGDALTEITIRETAFGRAQARQGAIAGAQAVGAPLIAAMTPQQALPNTTAALRVQLAELTQDFDNLDRSGEQYAQVAQRISEIQEELSRNILGVATAYDRHAAAENAAIRRAEKMRGVQEYYRGRGAATGFRDPGTGAIIAGGAPGTSQPLPIERPMREISGLFQQIGQIGMQPIISNIEMMGSSYEQVAASIKGATAASNGSISSLQAQRGAWQQLRAQLDPASAGFKQAGREIDQLDRRLEKFQSRRRQPLGAMGATQAAGAVISGGIFGGPEGAIGGAIGTAMGGVPGAFAGAAIGAQVGSIRQSLGAMAQFTAEIDKQRIALRNVVGDQEAYNNSLRFIDATSRRLAIPQDQLNKQFTQLAASVVGAGGNVDAAKAAFEGIAAGIRGTGGSLQDLQGALLATSQVFGKGKVSAEELRQQIGERMPGAFSIFAESIGKTPQELDKMLSRGEVGLNDFMKFVQELSRRYGASANEIAASSQSAGDRMATTFARIREAVGRELQPVGAQFQEMIARALTNNEQAIIEFAKGIASAAKAIADFLSSSGPAIVEIGKLALQFTAVSFAVKAFGLLFGPVRQGLALMASAFGAASAQAVVAQARLAALGTTVKALARSVAAPIVITVAILGAELVINYFNRIKAARDRLTQVGSQATGEQWLREIGGNALDQQQLTGALNDVGKAYEIATTKASKLRKERDRLKKVEGFDPGRLLSTLEVDLKTAEAEEKLLESRYKAGIARLPNAPNAAGLSGFNFPGSTEEDSKAAADKARKEAERLAAEQQRLNEAVMQQRLRIEDTVFKHQLELDRKRYELQKQLNDQQTQNRIAAETGVEREVVANFEQLKQRLREIDERQSQAGQQVRLAEQAFKTAKAMAEVTGQFTAATSAAGRYVQGGIGPRGASQYGPHFDIKRADRSFFAREALDAYVRVNGKPLSQGVTVPGGEFGARRDYGAHAGRDYAFSGQAALTLAGGAQWMGSKPGSYGDEAAFRTPDGKVYKIIHGKFEQAGKLPSGVAAQQRRDVKAEGTAGVEFVDVQAARQQQQLEQQFAAPQRHAAIEGYILQQTDAVREQNKAVQNSIELEGKRALALAQGYSPERIESIMKVAEQEQLRTQIVERLQGLMESNPEMTGELTQAIDEVNTEYTNLITTLETLYEIQSSPQARLQQSVGALKQELSTLADPVNQIIGAATAIGDAFGNSFKGLISGSMSAKEALRSFFQSTADYFLDMASQMIAKWITMKLIGLVGSLIPGGNLGGIGASNNYSGAFGNSGLGMFNPGTYSFVGGGGFANGGAFAQNGIVPYAKGGVVNRPTMFKFANGGTMQNGVMGEAGPEAIMPLKRGADGKLGVAANLDGAMSRYRRPPGAMTAAGDGIAAEAGAALDGGPMAIDVRYSVERINSVEYVTADQFQRGMQQAATQGAQQGEQRALRQLQQNTAVRGRVGLR